MSPLLVRGLLVLVVLGFLLRKGYERRRPVWERQSWIRFGTLLAGSLVLDGIATVMAIGVDNGIYDGMSPLARQTYFVTLMTLSVVAPLASVGLIVWFANGRADKQLGRSDPSHGA